MLIVPNIVYLGGLLPPIYNLLICNLAPYLRREMYSIETIIQ